MSNIISAISLARDFVLSKRSPDGLWRDFNTNAGASSDWVTCFVIHMLGAPHLQSFRFDILKKMLHRQRLNGGWSYNRYVPTDCDSTACALMAFSDVPIWKPSAIINAIEYIKRHHDLDTGGFSTYIFHDGIDKYINASDVHYIEGWTQPHVCVSSIALQAMIAHGVPLDSHTVHVAIQFLLNERKPSATWSSYWWKGYGYSTYQSLKALGFAGKLTTKMHRSTAEFLIQHQNRDGGWNDSQSEPSEVFGTAFNILTLLLLPKIDFLHAVKKAIIWLLSKQEPDGSWPTNPILRIPIPMEKDPDHIKSWRINERGTGVLIEDKERILTTSVALRTLSVYNSIVRP